MPKIEDDVRLRHMLDAANKINQFVQDRNLDELADDELLSLAIVRLLEIIGEAAANVSQEKQGELAAIPWRPMIGMRNRIVHAYFDINYEVVRKTILDDLPLLIAELELVLT